MFTMKDANCIQIHQKELKFLGQLLVMPMAWDSLTIILMKPGDLGRTSGTWILKMINTECLLW